MANMMALNSVYNHYLTTYSRGTVSKYDAHKKSELRGIYNSIVKMNKWHLFTLLTLCRPSVKDTLCWENTNHARNA